MTVATCDQHQKRKNSKASSAAIEESGPKKVSKFRGAISNPSLLQENVLLQFSAKFEAAITPLHPSLPTALRMVVLSDVSAICHYFHDDPYSR